MDLTKFDIRPINLAKEGWDINQVAEFYGITAGEFLIGIEHGKYPPGVEVEGGTRWHPGILQCVKAASEAGCELLHVDPSLGWRMWA